MFFIPLIGWILAIYFSFDGTYIARRNLFRAIWIETLIIVGLLMMIHRTDIDKAKKTVDTTSSQSETQRYVNYAQFAQEFGEYEYSVKFI